MRGSKTLDVVARREGEDWSKAAVAGMEVGPVPGLGVVIIAMLRESLSSDEDMRMPLYRYVPVPHVPQLKLLPVRLDKDMDHVSLGAGKPFYE